MTLSLRWDISTVHEGKKVKFDNVLNFAIRECLKKFNSIRQLQPSNFISNWNIPTDVALCHLMPQFLKLISTLKGVSQFFRVPYLFQCSFFSVHHHLAGPRNFINFFSSAVRTANKGTRNTYVHRRCFFQGKVNWKSYPRVPTRSPFFPCIWIWNTARLITVFFKM